MLLRPKTLRKYHEADETHEASSDISSIPRCSIGLKRRVSGKGTCGRIRIHHSSFKG